MKEMEDIDRNRRRFIWGGIGTRLAVALPVRDLVTPSSVFASQERDHPSNDATSEILDRIFQSDDKEVMRLVKDAYQQCILGKIHPPDQPLSHNWIAPGGGYYAQWLWDMMFVVDLLSILPKQEEIIRGVFQNYWDFQGRWNRVKPGFMHGMVAADIAPFDDNQYFPGKEWETFPAFS